MSSAATTGVAIFLKKSMSFSFAVFSRGDNRT
jgi:hypothetical protein